MSTQPGAVACIHACAMACGRTYDVILTQVVDGSTMFLCMPDFISFAANVAKAMTEPDDPQVKEIVANTSLEDVVLVTDDSAGYGIRKGPDPVDDDDFEFDGSLT